MSQATAAASPTSHRFLPFLVLLFVGSGSAALIYEIVWLQMLQLVIGSTALSLGILLGTFMGGMCLGSLLLPRFISAKYHPLRVYAFLEIGIAIFGVALLFGIPQVERLYTTLGHGTFGIAMRGVVAGLCLLPPTLLMGATLPAIARWVESTPRGVSWLGFFYGGNIAGAVFGCLLAGFYLLRVHDMAYATYVAMAINVAVAVLGLALAAFTRHEAPAESPVQADAPELAPDARTVYFVIAISGLCALGAEVVWTRLISLLLGGTVYTFSIILGVFLFGLGIGSAAGSFMARGNIPPRVLLGGCQLLLVAALGWSAHAISDSLPYWPVDPSIAMSPWFTFQLDIARTLWAVLPGAILWGASFPLALASVAAKGQDPGKLVGGVYAANTVGAIVGSLGSSIAIIPLIGTENSQMFLILLCVLAAALAFKPYLLPAPGDPEGNVAVRYGGALVALGLSIWIAIGVSPVPWGMVAYGRYMATYRDDLWDRDAMPVPGSPDASTWDPGTVPTGFGTPREFPLFVGEGMNVSVVVSQTREGIRSFHGGGKVQASSEPADMRLQRMLGHIPALIHPDPKSVLVVACGAGVTAGSFVPHPGVERIVICDIEPLVPTYVAPLFAKENHNVVGEVNKDRVQVYFDDGRHFIRTTEEKFDIITSDPIDPWVKGCAALNTVEYYQMCYDHLNDGGIMALWMPLYESNPATLKSVITTFYQVFPDGILWTNDLDGAGYDAVLFGQKGGTKINLDQVQERLMQVDHADVRSSLADVGFYSVEELFATYAGQKSQMEGWSAGAQINTDRNLRLQFLAGMWLNSYMGKELLDEILDYYQFPDNIFSGSQSRLDSLQRELRALGRGQ